MSPGKECKESSIEKPDLFTHITRTRILHVQDLRGSLNRIALELIKYESGQGVKERLSFFLQEGEALALFEMIRHHSILHQQEGVIFDEMRGAPNGNHLVRLMRVSVSDQGTVIRIGAGKGILRGQLLVLSGKPTSTLALTLSRMKSLEMSLLVLRTLYRDVSGVTMTSGP